MVIPPSAVACACWAAVIAADAAVLAAAAEAAAAVTAASWTLSQPPAPISEAPTTWARYSALPWSVLTHRSPMAVEVGRLAW